MLVCVDFVDAVFAPRAPLFVVSAFCVDFVDAVFAPKAPLFVVTASSLRSLPLLLHRGAARTRFASPQLLIVLTAEHLGGRRCGRCAAVGIGAAGVGISSASGAHWVWITAFWTVTGFGVGYSYPRINSAALSLSPPDRAGFMGSALQVSGMTRMTMAVAALAMPGMLWCSASQ